MSLIKYSGVTVNIAGTPYVVPPLTLRYVQNNHEQLKILEQAILDKDALELLIDVGAVALRRNYPDFQPEILGDWLDLGNAQDFIECLLDVSGFKRKSQDDAGKLIKG